MEKTVKGEDGEGEEVKVPNFVVVFCFVFDEKKRKKK